MFGQIRTGSIEGPRGAVKGVAAEEMAPRRIVADLLLGESAGECKGTRVLDCETDGSSRDESRA